LNLLESKIAPLDPPSPKTPPYNQTWSGSDDRLRRYSHSTAILDLFELEMAPLDSPSQKTHPRTKHEVDRTTGCGDIATWNFSNMAVAAILDLFDPPSRKPYPRTKHEVDRITRCRDMHRSTYARMLRAYGTPILGGRVGHRGSAMAPLERAMAVSTFL